MNQSERRDYHINDLCVALYATSTSKTFFKGNDVYHYLVDKVADNAIYRNKNRTSRDDEKNELMHDFEQKCIELQRQYFDAIQPSQVSTIDEQMEAWDRADQLAMKLIDDCIAAVLPPQYGFLVVPEGKRVSARQMINTMLHFLYGGKIDWNATNVKLHFSNDVNTMHSCAYDKEGNIIYGRVQ